MKVTKPTHNEIRTVAALLLGVGLLATVLVWPGAPFAAEGPNLPPAEYKPLPVGTRVNYDNWSYSVERNDGFESAIKSVGTGTWAQPYAVFGRQGNSAYTLQGGNVQASVPMVWVGTFDEKNRSILQSLWPLVPGKSVQLELEESLERLGSAFGAGDRKWQMDVSILRTEEINLAGLRYPVFIVEVRASSEKPNLAWADFPAQEYKETYWYNPDSGLILKFEREWLRGGEPGERDRYALLGVTYPKGTTTHALKGTTAGGVADQALVAEIERLRQEAEQAQEAEEARAAEIARLRQEAKEARQIIEEGPNLPPAEYKPLPVGTKVRYDSWSFEVTRTDDFEVAKRTNMGAWLIDYAVFGNQGTNVYTPYGARGSEWETTLDDETRSAFRSLWPLKVGNKIKLNFQEFKRSHEQLNFRIWDITVEVIGTEYLVLDGVRYPTFVIREEAESEDAVDHKLEWNVSSQAMAYRETKWFNPDSGLILKFDKEYLRGHEKGTFRISKLVAATFPKGTTTHALKGTTARGVADPALVAEIKRLRQEAEQAQEAEEALKARTAQVEKARAAEIARLRQEAEEARQIIEARKAQESGEEKERAALIARLKREADEARRAVQERKAQEAKQDEARAALIASLRKEIEEQRKADKTREAKEAEAEKANAAEIARLRKEMDENRDKVAQLSEQEAQELAAKQQEIARLKKAVTDRRATEAARKAEEANKEKARTEEIARLKREAEEARQAVRAREVEEVKEARDRVAEIARLKEEAARTRKALEAQKAAEAEQAKSREAELAQLKQARATEVANLKKQIEGRRQAEEARKAREAEAAKARALEIGRLKEEIVARRKAEEARRAQEAEVAKARDAEMARLRREVEERFWASVKDRKNLAAIQDYIKHYPEGRFAKEARARFQVLKRLKDVAKIAFGNYHALVIGINSYKHLPKLTTAINDAWEVARVLEQDYGFKVTLLTDPDRIEIIDALDSYAEKLGPKDNLLIYYAGHGWLNEEADRGYWLPADAKPKRRSHWVSNATITDTLKVLGAKHVMVIADSCYSGTLVRGADVAARKRTGDYWQEMAKKWARVAITSGGLEPVADKGGGGHSPFAKAFIDALRANDGVMDGTQLFSEMRRPVIVAAQQTPQYADVRQAGHDGGDFLFVRRK